ncbi:MAG: hypothetical protein K0U98_00115 [Deltaproteobacteria bacterium]|nr:hypothetical protein [Deltaproteobacteria bacterium]
MDEINWPAYVSTLMGILGILLFFYGGRQAPSQDPDLVAKAARLTSIVGRYFSFLMLVVLVTVTVGLAFVNPLVRLILLITVFVMVLVAVVRGVLDWKRSV